MFKDLSLKMKVFIPLSLFAVFGIIVIALTINSINHNAMVQSNIISATNIVNQFKLTKKSYICEILLSAINNRNVKRLKIDLSSYYWNNYIYFFRDKIVAI